MKKRVLSLMLTLCMLTSLFSAFSSSVRAASTPSDWALAEVNAATNEGLVTDKITKNYQKNITREEFCELVVKLYEKLTSKTVSAGDDPFSDTDNTEILKAYSLGIVKGKSVDKFAPDNTISRQEICVMLVRAIEAILGDEFILKYDFYKFDDNRDIATWAFEQVYYAYEKGIVKGVGGNKINPLGTATCEQAIIMIYRLHENIDECRDVIPQKVIDRHENYTYVNNTFKEIEKKYIDENGYVIPEKVSDLLDEVYVRAQEMSEEGEIQGVQLNGEYLNVCLLLKDGTPYIYSPPIEGLANAKTNIDVTAVNVIGPFESTVQELVATGYDNIHSIAKDLPEYIIGAAIKNSGIYSGNVIENFNYIDVNFAGLNIKNTCNTNSYNYIDYEQIGFNYLKYYLSNLNSENKQVFLWRGHGGVWDYKANDDKGKTIHDDYNLLKNSLTKASIFFVDVDSELLGKHFYEKDINEKRIIYRNGGYAITPYFIEKYLPEIKGGIFITGTCYGSADSDKAYNETNELKMSDAFINKGFDAYIGADTTVGTVYSDLMLYSLSELLCKYTDDSKTETITAGEALAEAKKDYGETEWTKTKTILEFLTRKKIDAPEFHLIGDSDFRLVGEWKDAYAKFLKELSNENHRNQFGGKPQFELAYINDDNIPELVITYGGSHLDEAYLYTFLNDEVKPIKSSNSDSNGYGVYGTFIYKERDSLIYIGGYSSDSIWHVDENMIATQKYLLSMDESNVFSTGKVSYFDNGVEITEAQYNAKYKEYGFNLIRDKYKRIEYGKSHDVTDDNIKTVLKINK